MSKPIVMASALACALLASAGCEKSGAASRFAPKGGASAEAPAPAEGGTIEERLARVEAELAKNREALAFLADVWNQQKAQREAQEASQPAPDAVFAIDITGNAFDGPADAPVTIVKAYDFDCPYCEMANDPMKQLVKDYGGKVRVVFKNFVIHPQSATTPHLAACAAGEQQKFVAFKDAFWEKGFKEYRKSRDASKMGEENMAAIAQSLGLNVDKFKSDMKGDKCKQLLERDMAELQKFGTNATPAFYINGQPYQGGLDPAGFKTVIEQKLKEVEASGVAAKDYYQKVVIEKGEKQFRSKKEPKPS